MSSADALQDALRAQHAAIFAYGALGAQLPQSEKADAAEAERVHRTRRDALAALLVGHSVEPVTAEPSYDVPQPLASAADARKLAVAIEERTATAWRAAVPELTGVERQLAVEGLAECAVRAARWRQAVNPAAPATVAFPG